MSPRPLHKYRRIPMNIGFTALARAAIFVIALLVSGGALAEGGCPPGQYPQQGQGWRTCVPIPGYQTEQAVQPPPPAYASRWGAVASTIGGDAVFGIVADQPGRDVAEKAAIAECSRRGGQDCQLNFTYANQCLAVMEIPNHPNQPFTGGTEDEATSQGLDYCKTNGILGCRVYYSGCSLSQRIQ